MRAMAEIDNTRKRLERDRDEKVKYALTSFAKDLLPAIDGFTDLITYNHTAEVTDNIWKLLQKALNSHGIKEVETPLGTTFDPRFHEVISIEKDTEYSSGQVSKILRKGYTVNERLIRPVTVMVAE